MRKRWDLILVGAGLANGLIAWQLRQQRPELAVLLLEAGPHAGGNHTWSFHQSDLTPAQHASIAPLMAHRWTGYDVRFPRVTRTLEGGYLSISAARFAAELENRLGEALRTRAVVAEVAPDHVILDSGERLEAAAVIDGRGYRPSPHLRVGWQAFVGQQWQLAAPHGLTRPILMDATVEQQGGYRFVYTLPLSPTCLLIEDTHYVDNATLDVVRARRNIAAYATAQGWQLATQEREERGHLPITLAGDPAAFRTALAAQPTSGLRAGLFHATTGYSLPVAMALAERIAAAMPLEAPALTALIERFAAGHWREQRFFRMLNRMLFLAGDAESRWRVMQRFYTLDADLIARFYAGHPRLADKARILVGKPPVPLHEALGALWQYKPRKAAT
ncbi:lycopene beta-cyclase CrtY [Salinicola avicenniae]|uniref:lycopene beta-cyclase CrtY n=1 Tax=Salinicola avicenniae TaxID=2916836 RepID=UPI002073C6DF|nr:MULTISPECIES: lycopene beta-cyclase CrtY [unclassified Salinicola]